MSPVNVYEQYFKAALTANGVERRAALVMLTATSEAGTVKYEAAVTFFPHRDEEDYAVSYDAYFSRLLFEGKGRRTKKRDKQYMDCLTREIDALAEEAGGKVFWDEPLREARLG